MIFDDALEFETSIVGSSVVESEDNITELKLELNLEILIFDAKL